MPSSDPGEIVERYLPDLLEYLRAAVPALATRPLLGSLITGLVTLGVETFFGWRERVRQMPIVPYALGHRATRRELAAFVRRRQELAHLRDELERAETAEGAGARRLWDELRGRVGEAQAELAAPMADHRGAVERVDSFLKALLRAGTVDLPPAQKRALLIQVRRKLGDET